MMHASADSGAAVRRAWVARLVKMSRPVLEALAAGELRKRMPVEERVGHAGTRREVSHLEAIGRALAGMAPWLELDDRTLADEERTAQAAMRQLAVAAVAQGVNPQSPDYLNFTRGMQPLVDGAFLAHAVVRAPHWLFAQLAPAAQERLAEELISTHDRKPAFCNWLLFSAMIEAGLFIINGRFDPMRVDYAVRQHDQWYKGGGMYGDGPDLHVDYYNSFVIQPMLIDVLRTVGHTDAHWTALLPTVVRRARRHAEVLERMVAPDGSFPAVGRSIAYRCGAFQHLAQMALQHELSDRLTPLAARGALNAVIARTLDAPGTYDADGWLRIGLAGHQPLLGESYISTGSLYLASTAFLPLGLPPTDPFWSDGDARFSGQRVWAGENLEADGEPK